MKAVKGIKLLPRPAVGCEKGAESLVANPVLQAARQTYLLFHKQCRVPGDSARWVALSEDFNQVVPQALCRNYSFTGLAETFKTFGLMGNRNMARSGGISRRTRRGRREQRRTRTIIIFGHAQILSFLSPRDRGDSI